MKRWIAAGLILATVAALALRLPHLEERPLHTDESVHAVKFLGLWTRGEYQYDPHEYHGPSLYYATLPLAQASNPESPRSLSESTLRLTPALFGAALVLMLILTVGFMGGNATFWAALLTAVTPSMVFYSRYFIHEMLLVVFTFGFLVSLYRYCSTPRTAWIVTAGICLGLMHATKETFLFPLAATVGAGLGTLLWKRLRNEPPQPIRWRGTDLAWGALAAATVSVMLFTSFFQNWHGPVDAWLTYGPWLSRAEGESPHVHPWHFYWQLLLFTHRGGGPLWTEALVLLLGLLGVAASLGFGRWEVPDRNWARFITFYTLGLSLIYTLIPYKTPWCLLGFWHGWILLAGIGAAALTRRARTPLRLIACLALLLIGTAHLSLMAHRSVHRYADSQRNPFVYAHTLTSILDLAEKVDELVKVAPASRPPLIKIMAAGGDYWPLPWYFRGYNTGWYPEPPATDTNAAADIIVASPEFEPAIKRLLGDRIQSLGLFGLRPKVFLQLHVEPGLWRGYLDRDRNESP